MINAGRKIYLPADILAASNMVDAVGCPRSARVLYQAASYLSFSLTTGHELLGRSGAVCPFVKPALKRNYISLVVSDAQTGDLDYILGEMTEIKRSFLQSRDERNTPSIEILKSYVVLFPYLSETVAADLIKEIQQRLKPDFVKDGLMIGEFFPGCETRGLHSASFRPLDTEFASLAIRSMVEGDLPFLVGNDAYVHAYSRRFGGDGAKKVGAYTPTSSCPHRADSATDKHHNIRDLQSGRGTIIPPVMVNGAASTDQCAA